MCFKTAVILLAVWMTSPCASGGQAPFGQKEIDAALKRAAQMQKTVTIPRPIQSVIHNETRPENAESMGDGFLDDAPDDPAAVSGQPKDMDDQDRLYLLISASMPMPVLQAYARQIQDPKHKNTVMALRGFVGGMKTIRPTLDFIRQVRCDDTLDVDFEIHPELFNQYGVTCVPAMIRQHGDDSFQITGAIDLDEAQRRLEYAMANP